tara:strand:+ start:500 stop:682 length:183 start_codon:yes stop_codon:yes gene_type:complete
MEKELDKIINSLDNGLIDNYIFYASSSFENKINSYKGVRIVYLNIIQDGLIYYSKNFLYK